MDANSILGQIYSLLWDAAGFKLVNEGRALAPKDERGKPKLNGMVNGLLDRCFATTQLIGIRRLIDTYPLTGGKGVYSLVSLIRDMAEHRHLFTRRNLFASHGCPIDLAVIREAELAFHDKMGENAAGAYCIPSHLDTQGCERLHKELDELCGTSDTVRAETDVVSQQVFDGLESRLFEATEKICQRATKFIAHAATPESREKGEASVTYDDLEQAHRAICLVCQFIDCRLLHRTSHSFLPMYNGMELRYIDQPLMPPDRMDAAREVLAAYQQEVEGWREPRVAWVVGAER